MDHGPCSPRRQAKRIEMLTLERSCSLRFRELTVHKRLHRCVARRSASVYLWSVLRSTSYLSSFLHMAKLSAAILRAIVSFAFGGFVPPSSNRS